MIALVFEGVKGFVFNSPSCADSSHDGVNRRWGEFQISHPGKVNDLAFGCCFPIFKEIDLAIKMAVIQRYPIDEFETVVMSLLVSQFMPLHRRVFNPVEQERVVFGFCSQDKPHIQRRE